MATNSNDWAREMAKIQQKRDQERVVAEREREKEALRYQMQMHVNQQAVNAQQMAHSQLTRGIGSGQQVSISGGLGITGTTVSSMTASSWGHHGLIGPLTRSQLDMLMSKGVRIGRMEQPNQVEIYVEMENGIAPFPMTDQGKADWQEGYDKGFEDGKKAQ